MMPLGALAVHQLRYQLAFGSRASSELSDQGHAYLSSAVPWIVLLSALALGAFLIRLAKAFASGHSDHEPQHQTVCLWLTAATGLLAIFVGQELLEGLLAAGHPGGPLGVFEDGGWWAVPASLAVGGLVTLALRGASAAIELAARRSKARLGTERRSALLRPAASGHPLDPLAYAGAPRAPPASIAILS
jgi:hypothetical protein